MDKLPELKTKAYDLMIELNGIQNSFAAKQKELQELQQQISDIQKTQVPVVEQVK